MLLQQRSLHSRCNLLCVPLQLLLLLLLLLLPPLAPGPSSSSSQSKLVRRQLQRRGEYVASLAPEHFAGSGWRRRGSRWRCTSSRRSAGCSAGGAPQGTY